MTDTPTPDSAPATLGTVYLPGTPGTPVGRFSFLVDPDVGGKVEIGTPVAADTEEGTIVGTVVDMVTVGTDRDPVSADLSRHPERVSHLPEVLCAEVQVFFSERMRPVRAGVVRAATAEEILAATGHTKMTWPIPGGVVEVLDAGGDESTFAPVCVDGAFLLGPEAQGIVVAGRSGVASKTSYLSVLLKSVLENSSAHAPHRTAVLAFNVKGDDLVWIDKPCEDGFLTDEDHAIYSALGITAEPFSNVTVYAPALGASGGAATRSKREDSLSIEWDLATIWRDLRFFWDDVYADEKVAGFIAMFGEEKVLSGPAAERITSFAELDAWFERELREADEAGRNTAWRDIHVMTLRRLKRRFSSLHARGRGLFAKTRVTVEHDVPDSGWEPGSVVVVDIAGMEPDVQGFVISRTVDRLMRSAELGELGVDHLVVVADELNQWAPSSGSEMTEVRKALRRVATQGRYAGLAIFGACQASSRVDPLLIENSASKAVGSSAETELTSGVHGRLSTGLVERIATLPKGQMALWHTAFRNAVVVRFPRPAWKMGKATTTAGARPTTGVGLLRAATSDRTLERLSDGLPKDAVEEIIATSGDIDEAKARLEQTREVDMTKRGLYAPSTQTDDPFELD